jgi:hypothetical protein
MGTRNLTIVKLDNKYKVAQYGQWDGNPESSGSTVLAFCREYLQTDRKLFEDKVRAAKWITDKEREDTDALIKQFYGGFGADTWKINFPALTRDTGAEILNHILLDPPGIRLENEIEFAANSLMCEWAYVIDLDKNTLEIFDGFNKEPLDEAERFHHLPPIEKGDYDGAIQYYPIKLKKVYSLDALPTQGEMEQDLGTEP